MVDMTEQLDVVQLTTRYRASFAKKNLELKRLLQALEVNHESQASVEALKHFIHKLSGSAAAYQFSVVADIADSLEQLLKTEDRPDDWSEQLSQLAEVLSSRLATELLDHE